MKVKEVIKNLQKYKNENVEVMFAYTSPVTNCRLYTFIDIVKKETAIEPWESDCVVLEKIYKEK
jgi:hypothetical protein